MKGGVRMFIVWYGNNEREFLVQTDDVEMVRAKVVASGYVVKEIVQNKGVM